MRAIAVVAAVLAATASTAFAWEIRLDLDTDNDPATINELTVATSAVVKVVLLPTQAHEVITEVGFGLGGSCQECEQVHQYGVAFDLFDVGDTHWPDNPDFTGQSSGALLLGCPADPGYHFWFTATPVAGSLVLEEPVFLATFNAWVTTPILTYCERTPANLAAMFRQGEGGWWNYVQLGGPAVPADELSWGLVKSLYD